MTAKSLMVRCLACGQTLKPAEHVCRSCQCYDGNGHGVAIDWTGKAPAIKGKRKNYEVQEAATPAP
jgi:hypothetical protein